MQEYTRTLITEEMHLGGLIEKAVKQIEEDKVRDVELEDDGDDDALEEKLFSQDEQFLTDQDFMDFRDAEEEWDEEDEEFFKGLIEEE
jgi:hypothetical protein